MIKRLKWITILVLLTGILVGLIEREGREEASIDVAGGRIAVRFEDGPFRLSFNERLEWVRNCAQNVAAYYGQFPVRTLAVRVRGRRGRGLSSGKTYSAHGRASIFVVVGRESSLDDLNREWVLTHEMVHTAFPSMPDRQRWIEEGIATYVEPWARVQNGQQSPEKVWGELVRDLPQGLPEAGDRGLDHTPTWGRIYWGGALYCLLADEALLEKTNGKKGLQAALRGINQTENISVDNSLPKALAAGDAATGTTVLTDLYEQMKNDPHPVDLERLWKKLGVLRTENGVRLDNSAPSSAVRRAIETGPK